MSTASKNPVIRAWNNYWFPDAPLLDLAILRIIAIGTQLGLMLFDPRYGLEHLAKMANVPDAFYRPLNFFQPVIVLLGGHRITVPEMQTVQVVTIVIGIFALIGLFSRVTIFLFALGCAIIQLWILSHGDIHHPEAAMVIALALLALAPSGAVLSVDAWLKRETRKMGFRRQLLTTSREAKWVVLMVQWFFGLMYLSAFWAKLSTGNLQWANGYTLQYYMAQDGARWDSLLGTWMSQFHWLNFLGQWGILLFQGTFFISLLIPILKWIYVPAGMLMHIGIYLTLEAPFFQWSALYFVFVPWTAMLILMKWLPTDEAQGFQLSRASAG